MAKSSLKNMVFRAEEDSAAEVAPGVMTVETGIRMFLEAGAEKWKPSKALSCRQRFAFLSVAAAGNDVEAVEDLSPKFARRLRAHRLGQVSGPTVHHDEVAMKMLTKWCAAHEYIARDPLASYQALPMAQAKPKACRPAERWELCKVVKVIENSHRMETARGSEHKRAAEYRYVKARDRMIVLTLIELGLGFKSSILWPNST